MSINRRFQPNKKYFTISVYSIVSVVICALFIKAIFFWGSTSSFISNLIGTLLPFIIAFLIAFLINPFVCWIKKVVLMKWFRIKNQGLLTLLSILIAYLVVLAAIVIGFIYLIPEIVNSLEKLGDQLPVWADSVEKWVNGFAATHPELNFDYVTKFLNNADSSIQGSVNDIISTLTSTVVTTGVSVIKFIYNFILAMIISCYLLIDKRMQLRTIKRIIYAFFKEDTAKLICHVGKESIRTFSNFFDGKMVDSLIIGCICFASMIAISFFGLPGFAESSLLVSIVVCITNMIPYFGPFLGGIPCTVFLCIYSPKSALVFGILIIIIQQLDGNVIGPKILGDSTGLRPLWIIFAITFGGWIGGVLGMFLGVPFVAVITNITEELVDARLKKKGINMPVITKNRIRKEKKPKIKK